MFTLFKSGRPANLSERLIDGATSPLFGAFLVASFTFTVNGNPRAAFASALGAAAILRSGGRLTPLTEKALIVSTTLGVVSQGAELLGGVINRESHLAADAMSSSLALGLGASLVDSSLADPVEPAPRLGRSL